MWRIDVLGVERGVSTCFDSLFSNYLLMVIGNGGNVLFWFEPWLDEKLLKDEFRRLLSFAVNKHEWNSGDNNVKVEWAWWRCRLEVKSKSFLRCRLEDLVVECRDLLDNNISLQVNAKNFWRYNQNQKSLKKETYFIITNYDSIIDSPLCDVTWSKFILVKISLFAWRLLNYQILAKDNLICSKITQLDSHLCVVGCDNI